MSLTQEQEQALGHLLTSNYAPAFVKRCAERGLNINSDEMLDRAMEDVAKLKIIEQQQNDQSGLVHSASYALDSAVYGDEAAQKKASAQAEQSSTPNVTADTIKALAALAGQPESK